MLLGVLILVHELGHFVFAKLFDVKVLRFSLGLRAALVRLHVRRDRIPAVADPARRLRAAAGRGSRRADPAQRSAARAGREAAVATLHGRHRRPGVQPAAAAVHLLHPLRRPAHAAAADHRDGAARPARRDGGPAARRSGRERRRSPRPLLGGAGERVISESAGKTLRFAIRRGPDAEERDVTPIEIERSGPLRRKERVGWIGVSPRFHLPEIGVLDPSSPAAQAGLKTFDFITAVNGVPVGDLGGVRQGDRARRRVAAAPQLRARRLLGGAVRAHRDRGARLGGGHPGRRVRRRRAAAATRPASCRPSCSCSRSSPAAPPTGSACGAAIRSCRSTARRSRHWDVLREQLASHPDKDFRLGWMSPGGRAHEASFRQEIRSSWTPTARRSSGLVFGALNRLAWKTEAPVPITNRFSYSVGHAFERTGRDHRDDGLRLRRDRARDASR